ncbi:MAG: DNA polymerase III subunit alpha, partial [Desulfovibrionales bacterium]|nr:DNA polymerase III subunit alpha [Desulfovibrionales bacterium]
SGEAIVFSEPYTSYRQLLESDEPLLLIGTVGKSDAPDEEQEDSVKKPKILAEAFKLLSTVTGSGSEPVVLKVLSADDQPDWAGLQEIFMRYPGQAPIELDLIRGDFICRLQLGPNFLVAPGPQFWRDFEQWQSA